MESIKILKRELKSNEELIENLDKKKDRNLIEIFKKDSKLLKEMIQIFKK